MKQCPECNSCQVWLWDDGYICCDCGTEFDELPPQEF